MKNVLFSLVIIFITGQSVFGQNALRAQLIAQSNETARRNLFNTYTPDQKASVWTDKLNQVINYGGWNNQQLNMLYDMKQHIEAENYVFNNPTRAAFLAYYQNFEAGGIQVFSKIIYGKIFVLIGDYKGDEIPKVSVGNSPDCECCKSCTFTCDWISGSSGCGKSACAGASTGCGGLWAQECNGDCNIMAFPSGGDEEDEDDGSIGN